LNDRQWKIFCQFRTDFKKKVNEWSLALPELGELQKKAVIKAKSPLYSFETPLVYNSDLDKITCQDEIKLIVIGDNPGKEEQLAKNQRYLCGQAGKLAEGFFRRNEELSVDFRKNVIILNKTPVHSAKTAQLAFIMKEGGKKAADLILESQLWMAKKTAELHIKLLQAAQDFSRAPELWLVGYSELKGKGFFLPYARELQQNYRNPGEKESFCKAWEKLFVYQHFSMNRFSIDLASYVKKNEDEGIEALSLKEQLEKLGRLHKEEIFISFQQ